MSTSIELQSCPRCSQWLWALLLDGDPPAGGQAYDTNVFHPHAAELEAVLSGELPASRMGSPLNQLYLKFPFCEAL